MAEGFYYNQEVTAEMLNTIATDLGHTSFNGFGEEKFGTQELNKITKDLVSAGVLISGDMCRVIKDDSGNIILQTGIIVFNDGAKMEVSSPVTIAADAGTVIYAFNDTLQGKCTIEVAESYPTEGDFVKLCTVYSDGSLGDNRMVSKAKMELNTTNSSWSKDVEIPRGDSAYIATEIPSSVWDKYNYIVFLAEFNYSGTMNHDRVMSKGEIFYAESESEYDNVIIFNRQSEQVHAFFLQEEDNVVVNIMMDNTSSGVTGTYGGTVTIMLI